MASTTSLVILDPNSSNEYPNQCVSGFIRNIGNVSGNFLLLQTSGKTIKRTLAPLQSYTFTNYYIKSIKNTGTTQLEVELSDSPNTQSNLTIQQLDIGTISGTVNINGNVVISGIADVNITNTTVNVAGTVYVNGIVDVSIQNTTVNVNGSVSISGTADVNITNTTVNVGGNVVVSGTVSINGIVDVNIQNTTVNVNGSVSISGTADVSITNSTININGNVNISSSVQLPTDIGNYTQSLQENQTDGDNVLTYNPWNFSTSTSYAVSNVGIGDNVNVQQNNARGYLNFWFYVYNYTNSTGSTTVTINLYEHLPTSGTSATPIQQFSFNTGNIASNSGAWVNVNPNIYWQYNSLVAQPSSSTTPVTTYPITLSGVPTGTGTYQQLLTISNPSQYGINSTGSNIQFTTANGTKLYAWIESMSSSSMNVWILNNDSNSTINMNIYPSGYNFFSSTGYLGEAPQLSSTYGQYDNGALVFNNYWNFAGTTLPSGWTLYTNGGTTPIATVSNGVTITGGGSLLVGAGIYYQTIPSGNIIAEYYGNIQSGGSGLWVGSGTTSSSDTGDGYLAWYQGASPIIYRTNGGSSFINVASGGAYATGNQVVGLTFATALEVLSVNNVQQTSGTDSTYSPSSNTQIALRINEARGVSLFVQWLRTRTYVSSMPTYSIGSGSTSTISYNITVAIPSTPNNINSHYWNGSYWNASASGFIGFWQITEASPASLPVMVTNPIQISQGYTESVSSTSSAEVTLFTVPNGKKYKLLNVYFAGIGTGAAVNVYAFILRNGEPINVPSCLNFGGQEVLYFENVNLATSSCFGGASFVGSSATAAAMVNQIWPTYPEMYPGDKLLISNRLNRWALRKHRCGHESKSCMY